MLIKDSVSTHPASSLTNNNNSNNNGVNTNNISNNNRTNSNGSAHVQAYNQNENEVSSSDSTVVRVPQVACCVNLGGAQTACNSIRHHNHHHDESESQISSPRRFDGQNAPVNQQQPQLNASSSSPSLPPLKHSFSSDTSRATVDADAPTHLEDCSITILHFNDCYNVEPGPESSGAAGFLTAINQLRNSNPMILFSGDIISPSFMSTFTKGEQMIPVLNDIGVHCAVFGNHEFDYGVDNLIKFTKQTSFPWLLSNVIDKETSNQLGDGQVFHVLERGGLKFGLIGLIEEEWLSTLSTLDSSDVIYRDFVEVGQELARWLKSEPHNVDYVIALTHCRTPNDIRLADSVPEIDLILGGHDHDYEVIERPNCYIVKSGTDFREFSEIKLQVDAKYLECKRSLLDLSERNSKQAAGLEEVEAAEANPGRITPKKLSMKPIVETEIKRVDCSSFQPDENLRLKLERFVTTIDEKMGQVLGQFNCELDGRFSSIRKFETNLGNFVTDIMLASTHADLAILNSGTLRSDRIHPRGDFTMRDLFNILGYIDPIAVLEASGYHIWQALENGVSAWPKLEGRFPQISGCTFTFDPSRPSMSRILAKDIMIGDEPLDLDRQYKLTTKDYLASGKDGYDILKECQVLVPGDESPDLTTSILNHFEAINIIKSNRRTHHRQSLICLSRSSLKKMLDQTTQQQQQEQFESTITSSAAAETTMAMANNTQQQQFASTTNNDCSHYYDDNNNNSTINDNESGSGNLNEFTTTNFTAANNSNSNATSLGDEVLQSPEINNIHSHGKISHHHHHNHLRHQPASSSPLVGMTAPTPTLRNMASLDDNISYDLATATSSPATTPLSTIQKPARTKRLMSVYEMEHEQCKLEPKVEGRIRILGINA